MSVGEKFGARSPTLSARFKRLSVWVFRFSSNRTKRPDNKLKIVQILNALQSDKNITGGIRGKRNARDALDRKCE